MSKTQIPKKGTVESNKSTTTFAPDVGELLQIQESYRTIIENSLSGMYIIQSGQFKFANSRMAEILGFDCRDDLIGRNFWEVVHPDDSAMVKERELQRETTQVDPSHYVYRGMKTDGTLIWVEMSGSPATYMGKPAVIGNIIDITSRKNAEEAWQESEQKYRTLLDDIEEGYFENDLKGVLTYVNGSYCRIFGYHEEELIGQNFRRLLSDDASAEEISDDYNQIYKTGQPLKSKTYSLSIKEGIAKHIEITSSLNLNSNDKPIGFRGIIHDVTDKILATEALHESEEKYRTILENIEDGYIEVDVAGNTTFCNEKTCQIFGYPREELMGMNNRQYMEKEAAKAVYKEFNQVYRSGKPGRPVAYEVIRKDSSRRFVEINISLRKDKRGEIEGFNGIVRDITDRVEADNERERYRSNLEAIFRSVKDAIVTVDLDTKVIEANESAQKICGLAKAQVIGQKFSDCFDSCSGACHRVLLETLEKKETVEENRIECQHLNKPEQIVSANSTPLLDSQGQLIGAVLVLRDTTRLNDLE